MLSLRNIPHYHAHIEEETQYIKSFRKLGYRIRKNESLYHIGIYIQIENFFRYMVFLHLVKQLMDHRINKNCIKLLVPMQY
jgi:hypothetical protein